MINNAVHDGWGEVVGFRCSECGEVVQSMMGNTRNRCAEKERRHHEMLRAIKRAATPQKDKNDE